MERKALWLVGGILALAVPAFAQTAAGDTIAALLVEVRQLRIAMERAATTTPQVQLLGARLSVQNERLARVERDHDNAKRELDDLSAARAPASSDSRARSRCSLAVSSAIWDFASACSWTIWRCRSGLVSVATRLSRVSACTAVWASAAERSSSSRFALS